MRLSHCFVFMSLLGAAGCGEADGPAVDVGDTGAPTDGALAVCRAEKWYPQVRR